MVSLTQKQIKILKVLAERDIVVAPWNHHDLFELMRARFATSHTAYQASGRPSSNKVWAITEAGRDFLETERDVHAERTTPTRRWEPDF